MGIYLDDAATSRPNDNVIHAVHTYMDIRWGNPSATYSLSSHPADTITEVRRLVKDYINASPVDSVVFTSGGSESNSWAIQGWVKAMWSHPKSTVLITSNIEHASVMDCVTDMTRCWFIDSKPKIVHVDHEGFVRLNELKNILDQHQDCNILVSIQFANNEIGTIQHIKEISDLVHRYGGVFHTDAVQAFGHIPIDVQELGIDMLSASGHKIGAPKGVGLLYIRNGIELAPLIYGKQNDGLRGGTENVAGIAGFGVALNNCRADIGYELRLTLLRNNLLSLLKPLNIKVNGSLTERLPNNLSITFCGDVSADNLVYLLDTCGVYIGTGAACNSTSIKGSHVLRAIGLNDFENMKTIRLTLPRDITMEELEQAAKLIKQQVMLMTIDENNSVCARDVF